jgi:hypothetical protein
LFIGRGKNHAHFAGANPLIDANIPNINSWSPLAGW